MISKLSAQIINLKTPIREYINAFSHCCGGRCGLFLSNFGSLIVRYLANVK